MDLREIPGQARLQNDERRMEGRFGRETKKYGMAGILSKGDGTPFTPPKGKPRAGNF